MPSNFRLNVQDVFRRLGMQSVRLPRVSDNVQMTMLVTDLSRLIPAPIEPRGFAGVNLAGLAGQFGAIQIRALSSGGIFIEQLILRSTAPAAADDFQLDVTVNDLGLPLGLQINIGGTPIQSLFTAGSVPFTPIAPVLPAPASQVIPFEVGIFVPNQAFFQLRGHRIGVGIDVAVVYRELPSVEEVG